MNNAANRTNDSLTEEQFSASFINVLKNGTRIATGNEKTAGEARELMNRLRAEIEEDKRERR